MLSHYRLIDLTHSIDESIPTWNGSCGFHQEIKMDYERGCRVMSYKCHAGVGTHMDAPSHFIPGAAHIADIPLQSLLVPACVIDVSSKQHPDLFISCEDIEHFERKQGIIPDHHLVLAHTGWDQHWHHSDRYRNPDSEGRMHFPGFHPDAAQMLLDRKVVGIGIDTLSPDGSNTHTFPVHHLILGAGKYILENLTHLDQLPAVGAFLIVLPPKIKTGTEAFVRAVALIR